MKNTVYLMCNANGVEKMLKVAPQLRPGEVCIVVEINVPNEAFNPIIANVVIDVPETILPTPVIEVKAEAKTRR